MCCKAVCVRESACERDVRRQAGRQAGRQTGRQAGMQAVDEEMTMRGGGRGRAGKEGEQRWVGLEIL